MQIHWSWRHFIKTYTIRSLGSLGNKLVWVRGSSWFVVIAVVVVWDRLRLKARTTTALYSPTILKGEVEWLQPNLADSEQWLSPWCSPEFSCVTANATGCKGNGGIYNIFRDLPHKAWRLVNHSGRAAFVQKQLHYKRPLLYNTPSNLPPHNRNPHPFSQSLGEQLPWGRTWDVRSHAGEEHSCVCFIVPFCVWTF